MKKKNVLRLLAFVMAASLTVTSAPAGLLSGTETVYAADESTLTSDVISVTSSDVTVKSSWATTNRQFLVVGKNETVTDLDSAAGWVTGTGAAEGTLIRNDLIENTTYYIYWRYVGQTTNGKAYTFTTNKNALKDARVTLAYEAASGNHALNSEATTSQAVDANGYYTSDYEVEYDGTEKKPIVSSITLADGTVIRNASNDISNFTITYLNNTNAGAAGDGDEAPTVKIEGKGKYEGVTYVTFTINPYDLTVHSSKVRTYFGENENKIYNNYAPEYTGRQINPYVKLQVLFDGASDYTTLKQDTDFVVDPDASWNSSWAAVDGLAQASDDVEVNSINYNIDAGTVHVVLAGDGNYTGTAESTFEIKKSGPTAPSAPTVTTTTANPANSITIDTSDEDLKYTYQYMILDAEVEASNITWENQRAVAIVSPTSTNGGSKKQNIVITYDTVADTTTATYADGTVIGAGVTFMNGSPATLLADRTYYVVRKIVSDNNVTESSTSTKASVTMAPTDINNVVDTTTNSWNGTLKNKTKNTTLTANADGVFTSLNKIYDGKDQDEVDVALADNTVSHNTMNGYVIKYYNNKFDNNKNGINGVENDRHSAGVVSVYAVGDWSAGTGTKYSGYYLLGTYTIQKRTVNAVVENGAKEYDGSQFVYGLSATATTNVIANDSVTVTGLRGTTKFASAGTQELTAVNEINGTTQTGTNSENYIVRYDYTAAEIVVSKATVKINGSTSLSIAFGEQINLASVYSAVNSAGTGMSNLHNLKFVLTDTDGTLANKLTLTGNVLELKDYDTLKNKEGIIIKVSYNTNDAKETNDYSISDYAGLTVNVTLTKASTKLEFYGDTVRAQNDPWNNNHAVIHNNEAVLTFESYVRPSVIRAAVENQFGLWQNRAGILTSYCVIDPAYDGGQTDGAALTDTANSAIYLYYDANGKLLNTNVMPSEDGEYTVKAYVGNLNDVAEKNIDDSKVAGTLKIKIGTKSSSSSSSSGNTSSSTEEIINGVSGSEGFQVVNGKVYTVKDDTLITSAFVQITKGDLAGKTVYANKNGVMVHGKSFKAVDGYWHYANEDGSVITEAGVQDTDENGKVYSYGDNNGRLLVSGSKVADDGNKYVANARGMLVKSGFTTTKNGYTYYTEDYKVVTNKKFTTAKGKTYIANKNGSILKGKRVVTFQGNKYYVYAKGSVAISKSVKYNGKTYVANSKGVLKLKK
jgi:hypothetical protein